jgi:hypothetical protein
MRTSLYDVQSDFRRFIASQEPGALAGLVCGDAVEAMRRLAVYRNNSLVAHTTALGATYPVVRRLVDGRFFAYAVHEFLRANPPSHPCLAQFGARFPSFLESFAPAVELRYLPDIAQLEWDISRIAGTTPGVPLPIEKLVERQGDPALARLRLDPATRFVASDYPIDVIWTLNQPDSEPETALPDESVWLEVRGSGAELLRRHDRGHWTFRSALAAGSTLGAAAEDARRQDCAFDLAAAIAALFAERLVVACE